MTESYLRTWLRKLIFPRKCHPVLRENFRCVDLTQELLETNIINLNVLRR